MRQPTLRQLSLRIMAIMLMDVFPLLQPEPPVSINMNHIMIQHKITSWFHADENISHEFIGMIFICGGRHKTVYNKN